ncbi:SPOR domain-containing protein [Brevundimonas sp.]|uniref:SPOR domain-containing protein n=1 Tax=Brevundimonas sp. TaxID=1871086 RepID=UPI002FDB3EAE
MSFEDDPRSRERGAYTPPTDDDLPFRRGGGYDARGPRRTGGGGAGGPPVTLIVSALVLLLLIVAVVVFYRAGARSSTDAPPAVGQPVGAMKVEAPIEAQPIDPEAGIRVYRDGEAAGEEVPTFAPPPETPLPRPTAPVAAAPPAAKAAPAPHPATPAAPVEKAEVPAPAAGGSSAVQIGAFSSTALADREYAAVAARFPQFAQGAGKRVQEVTASNGSTVYRTTFTGLSRERATAFCAALRGAGRDCLVR